MMIATKKIAIAGSRKLSTKAATMKNQVIIDENHPRVGIAKNYMKLRRIADATDEDAVRKALTDKCTLNQVVAQKDISNFERWLYSSTTTVKYRPYVPNPNAWQNKHWLHQGWRESQKMDQMYLWFLIP